MRMARSKASVVCASMGPTSMMPALLTSTSMRPKWAMRLVDQALAFGGVGEIGCDEIEVLRLQMRVLCEQIRLGLLELLAIAGGQHQADASACAANLSAIAKPRPREPPVMRTTASSGTGCERRARGQARRRLRRSAVPARAVPATTPPASAAVRRMRGVGGA